MTKRNVREKEEVTVLAHPSLSRLGDPTFIPYNDALDIDGNGKSNFDVLLSAHRAYYHNEVPIVLIRPILVHLDIKNYWNLRVKFDKSKYDNIPVFDGDTVTYDVSASDGEAPYSVNW